MNDLRTQCLREPPVAILGAGLMGVAIAAANVSREHRVILVDSDPAALSVASRRIAAELDAAAADVASGQSPSPSTDEPHSRTRATPMVSSDSAETTVARLVTTTSQLASIAECRLVLETIHENAASKRKLFGQLAPYLGAGAVLVSNTSTIPIARLAEAVPDAARFCGIHFFHPVRRRRLVEIVRGPQTADATVERATEYAKSLEKRPLVVNDGPGFLVNRLLAPYLGEAMELLRDGTTIDEVERAAEDFGMAFGPLHLADEIGLDTTLLGGRVLWEAFPERIVPSPLLIAIYKAGRYGRKTGRGFFSYVDGQSERIDAFVEKLIADWARPTPSPNDMPLITRMLLPMVLEAARILEERRVVDPGEIDIATVMGLGFPSQRGLLRWVDEQGIRRLVAASQSLESLGPRYHPNALLLDMASRDARFLD